MSKSINIPSELVESIQNKECIAFIASGLSAGIVRSNGKNLPSWKSFLLELHEFALQNRVLFNSNPEEIKEMIDKGNFLMAAQELQEIINENDFAEFLSNVFRDTDVKPSNSHLDLTSIPFRALLTTNYDSLLEGAYTLTSKGQIPKSFTQFDLNSAISHLRNKNFFIFKMHGDLDRPNTIVLGTRSYENLLYNSPNYLSFLETIFTTHTVLFIGFGGSDPDLDYLLGRLSTIFSRTLNKHYILAPNNKFNFTEKRRLLLDKRLDVIEYDPKNNHEEVGVFIKELKNYFDQNPDEVKINDNRIISLSIISSYNDIEIEEQLSTLIEEDNNLEKTQWSQLEYFLDTVKAGSTKAETELARLKGMYTTETELIIILISSKSLESEIFVDRLDYALLRQIDRKIRVLPVIIGESEIPYKLTNYYHVKLKKKPLKKDLLYLINRIKTMAT